MSAGSEPLGAQARVGLGWDRHRMEPGRPCVLGGVTFDCPVGPAGHSDGDAVLHALADAVLGAAGQEDLGTLFPDDAPEHAGADSAGLLAAALERAASAGWQPASADVVVVCDRPRLGPRREALRTRLAGLLGLPVDRVNLKGKTTEGRGGPEAVEATAVVLLAPR